MLWEFPHPLFLPLLPFLPCYLPLIVSVCFFFLHSLSFVNHLMYDHPVIVGYLFEFGDKHVCTWIETMLISSCQQDENLDISGKKQYQFRNSLNILSDWSMVIFMEHFHDYWWWQPAQAMSSLGWYTWASKDDLWLEFLTRLPSMTDYYL